MIINSHAKPCVDCLDYEQNIKAWIEKLGGDSSSEHISLTLESLVDTASRAPEDAWISVEDRLPEVSNGMFLVSYMFQGKHQCMAVAAWYGDRFHDINLVALEVTHWQPKPAHPKES